MWLSSRRQSTVRMSSPMIPRHDLEHLPDFAVSIPGVKMT